MKNAILFFSLIFLFQFKSQSQTSTQFRNAAGTFSMPQNKGLWDASEWNAIPAFDGKRYLMLQFQEIPTPATWLTLQQRNIELLSYAENNIYFVAVPQTLSSESLASLPVRGVAVPRPEQKIHAQVQRLYIPSYAVHEGKYRLMVSLFPGVKHAATVLAQYGTLLNTYNQQHISIEIQPSVLNTLASLPFVQFIDWINAPAEPENLENRTDHRSNNLHTEYGAGRQFDGSGVRIALTDDGLIGPHIDYQGRTVQSAVIGINNGDHGDHCAGIIMGAGNKDPLGRGMAPGSDLWVYEAVSSNNYILDDSIYTSPVTSIDIVSTSYSDGCNTGYNAGAESADRQINSYKNVMRVFSAGNNGTADCSYGAGAGWGNITGGIKSAKNLIAVANLDLHDGLAASSSRGPATDGRLKPDVSAVGTNVYSTIDTDDYDYKSGTSMSCPGVSGTLAQLYQAYRTLNSGQDPNMGLLKNVVMNTADDLGNPGPDFKFGYGRINGLRAVKILEGTQYLTDSVLNGNTRTHTLTVPANTQRVKIMLNWLDKQAAVGATTALINDLDLKVTDALSVTFLPWVLDPTPVVANLNANAVRAADHLNNAEQVTIDNPAAGTYTIEVQGFSVPFGPQTYFISYEFISNNALEVTYPIGGEGFAPGETQVIRWDAIDNGNPFYLSYSTDNGMSWNPIISGIASNQNYFDWTVPNLLSGQCRIKVTRNGTPASSPERFSIIPIPANVTISRVCPDTITLNWSPVAGATSYEVYMLGNKYMDSVNTTTDTFYHFTGLNSNTEHWFSVRAVSNSTQAKSRRAIAVKQVAGLSNCILGYDLQALSSPQPGYSTYPDCINYTLPVSIEIKNSGSNALSGIQVYYQLDGNTPVAETFTGSLNAGQTATHIFSSALSALAPGNHQLTLWCHHASDMYAVNDTTLSTIWIAGSTTASLPWSENFDGETLCTGVNVCDFTECPLSNMVNEKNGVSDAFDWKVFEGSTPSTSTGPDNDHTGGSADRHYVYTEASYCYTQKASLLTPCFNFPSLSKPALNFWYHMYGVDQGELHVDAFVNNQWQPDIMPVLSGDAGNTWKFRSVDLSSFAGQKVFFRFRGITGSGSKSDMALDDISVVDSAAASLVTDHNIEFNVYPNPMKEVLIIESKNHSSFDRVELYNATGQQIITEQKNMPLIQMSVRTATLSPGVYWVQVLKQGQVMYRKKLIKW